MIYQRGYVVQFLAEKHTKLTLISFLLSKLMLHKVFYTQILNRKIT